MISLRDIFGKPDEICEYKVRQADLQIWARMGLPKLGST